MTQVRHDAPMHAVLFSRSILAGLALATLVPLAGCSDAASEDSVTSVVVTAVPLPSDVPLPENWPNGIPIPEIDRMSRTIAVIEESPEGPVYRLEYTGIDVGFLPFFAPYTNQLIDLGWERGGRTADRRETFSREDSVLFVGQKTRDAQEDPSVFIIQSEQRGSRPLR